MPTRYFASREVASAAGVPYATLMRWLKTGVLRRRGPENGGGLLWSARDLQEARIAAGLRDYIGRAEEPMHEIMQAVQALDRPAGPTTAPARSRWTAASRSGGRARRRSAIWMPQPTRTGTETATWRWRRERDARGAARPETAPLHNCGPSSREVFRTPAIGRLATFDLRRALLGWTQGREGFDITAGWPEDGVPAPAELVARIARTVLIELEIEAPPEGEGGDADRARRCLGALVGGLRERGRLRRLVGIAFHAARTGGAPEPPARKPSTLQLATTLAVFGVYAPPLLLWTRTLETRLVIHHAVRRSARSMSWSAALCEEVTIPTRSG